MQHEDPTVPQADGLGQIAKLCAYLTFISGGAGRFVRFQPSYPHRIEMHLASHFLPASIVLNEKCPKASLELSVDGCHRVGSC